MDQSQIRSALTRAADVYTKKPSLAKKTINTTTILEQGLQCSSNENTWSIATDMAAEFGGNGSAPSPGLLARAALGSCLATSYAMWAASQQVPIDSIEIEIESDSNAGGLLGTAEIDPGHSAIRYHVKVNSNADESTIVQLLDTAEKHCPVLDIFRRPIPCSRRITLNGR